MAGRRVYMTPDKFKGTLSAAAAAQAMAAGARRALGASVECVLLPLADGGEGSLSALYALEPDLSRMKARIKNAHGKKRAVTYLADPGHAYFETARLLSLRFRENRAGSILTRTSAGLGQWLRLHHENSPHSLAIFLGGTAVCDGGFGTFLELGAILEDRQGRRITTLPALPQAVRLILPEELPSFKNITVLSDVTNPLVGPRGAARLFAPQKGASPADVELLENALRTLAELVRTAVPQSPEVLPNGIGAGGGIALPLFACFPTITQIRSGTEFFLSRSGLADRLRPGDTVITGEGRTDSGTLSGKLVDGVVRLCREKNVTCMIVSGSIGDEPELARANYPAVHVASPDGPPATAAAARELLSEATRRALLQGTAAT